MMNLRSNDEVVSAQNHKHNNPSTGVVAAKANSLESRHGALPFEWTFNRLLL